MATEQSAQWSSNANEAFHIRLKSPHTDEDLEFHPAFTYPIFGEEETIYGYRDLKITLDFSADKLEPSLKVAYSEKLKAVGETQPDDVEGLLKPYLPALAHKERFDHYDGPFTPPGELLHQYEIGGKKFGIWSPSLDHPQAKQLLYNAQILIPLFIEGGTPIELNDPEWTIERWRVFFIYMFESSPDDFSTIIYSFAGYSTTYRCWFLDPSAHSLNILNPSTEMDEYTLSYEDPTLGGLLPSRPRISQFLILPPYQSSGHGSHLYWTMMQHFRRRVTVREITVEDPNEAFDDLRDQNDIAHLRRSVRLTDGTRDIGPFSDLKINTSVALTGRPDQRLPSKSFYGGAELAECLKIETKIAQRQLDRLVEMQLLHKIPARHRTLARITRKEKCTDENDRAYYFWRLLVKQRLYKHNLDQLGQLDLEERIDKLDETLAGVQRDYERLLERAASRDAKFGHGEKADGNDEDVEVDLAEVDLTNGTPVTTRGAKRRILDDDSDDVDELPATPSKTKRPRTDVQMEEPAVSP